ncbi:gliding motility-associated C-terminal domain-containing protein [Flavobacterium sp.]|uniref:gliding motility-associated C-terminal domain-containing protein n=1 Tax=Flavobacterium sp. TaxID=239 RepID=UPI002622BE00|nr:gliding motility-associated C-terminal domain-containing protein [Flavobacterium sp.]
MDNKTNTYKIKKCILGFAMGFIMLCIGMPESWAQVRVPYKVRTSQYSPSRKVYSLNGDFTFIGNTNLTLLNYEIGANNNNNLMRYVDVDNDPATWNSSSAELAFTSENGASPTCTNIVFAGLYWTGKSAADNSNNSSNNFSVTKIINGQTVTKDFSKRKILLKGPNASSYSEFIANEDAIYYPNNSDAFIYSAYTEVTDYVRQHGIGSYFAADMALVEGNGGGTGYSGGWGLVVVYENAVMKHRDISLFDGHAFVLNSNNNGYNLEVSGFHTVQTGNVGVKLGFMASEGDVGLDGDYFEIQKNSDLGFMKLQHAQNSADNFFNSTITNGNLNRNPNLANNTGIDIALFDIPNENNTVIGNNQSNTNFRYGTNSDTYAIFAIALAVDSYVPEVENIITATEINHVPATAPFTSLPGQEIKLKVSVKNTENEAINGFKITVPIPYNATYIEGSASGNLTYQTQNPLSNAVHFDATLGPKGSLIWDYGTLPLPANPDTILANLIFKVRTTDDCALLKQSTCALKITIDGFSEGIGAVSGVAMRNNPFILGTSVSGNCSGNPIKGPLTIAIDALNYVGIHCLNSSSIRNFTFCNTDNLVNINEVASNFPAGCLFYNAFPMAENTIQYSINQPFTLIPGERSNYFAVSQNPDGACVIPFTLSKCIEITANTDHGNTINGNSGGITLENVLSNDFLNGHMATASEVQLSFVSASNPGISLVGNNVTVAAGTPAGTYTLTYQICDITDSTKCDQAVVTVSVTSNQIIAENDTYEYQCSTSGFLGNILNNDTLNGNIFQAHEVIISIENTSSPKIVIDTATGKISIAEGLTAGRYNLQYKISQIGNPQSFDIASISIHITDTTAPELPELHDIVKYCEAEVLVPTTTDNCSGLVCGSTSDALHYDTPGNYRVHWTFTDESGNQTPAVQNVEIKSAEGIEPGYGYADCNLDNDNSLNIDLNTYLPEGMSADGIWTSEVSIPNLNGSVFSPYQAPTGSYNFKYIHSEEHCSQTLEVFIDVANDCFVAPACSLTIHNAFSPNNDGVNEVFVIENIDQIFCFPTNSVEIFNRWGVLVYKTKQYDNKTRVFKGISEARATLNESDELPTGTYFYVINYTDDKGNALEQSGYLYLSR